MVHSLLRLCVKNFQDLDSAAMKKIVLILQIVLFSISSICAQTYTNAELYKKFQNKELSYKDFDTKRLVDYLEYFTKYHYKSKIVDATALEYMRYGTPYLEIEKEDGNIYTHPSVFISQDKNDHVYFYNTKMRPSEGIGWTFTSIYGVSYSTHLLTMDYIKIGKQTAEIRKCFSPLYAKQEVELFEPNSYIKTQSNKLFMAVDVTYAGEPEVIYTQPHYVIVCGQLFETNSGVNYSVPLYKVGYVCHINTTSMTSDFISLEGISWADLKYDENGDIYIYSKSIYGSNLVWGEDYHKTFSRDRSPIYIASMDEYAKGGLKVKTAIIPDEGEIITDIQRYNDYLFLCGSTTQKGYVGYNNPIFIIMKKKNDTYEEIARYRSPRKDRFYVKIIPLDNNHICLRYDNWCDRDVRGGDPTQFHILNISSLINK